jgi:hypothetical protein
VDPKAEAEMEREIMKGSSPLAVYLLPFLPKAKLSYAEYETKETEGVDRGMVERLKARGVKRLTFHFDILDVVVNDPTLLRTVPKLSEEELKALNKELTAFKEEMYEFMRGLNPPGANTTYVGAVTFDLFRERITLAYRTIFWNDQEKEWVPVQDTAVKVEVSLEKFLKLKEKVKTLQALSEC